MFVQIHNSDVLFAELELWKKVDKLWIMSGNDAPLGHQFAPIFSGTKNDVSNETDPIDPYSCLGYLLGMKILPNSYIYIYIYVGIISETITKDPG